MIGQIHVKWLADCQSLDHLHVCWVCSKSAVVFIKQVNVIIDERARESIWWQCKHYIFMNCHLHECSQTFIGTSASQYNCSPQHKKVGSIFTNCVWLKLFWSVAVNIKVQYTVHNTIFLRMSFAFHNLYITTVDFLNYVLVVLFLIYFLMLLH